MVLLDVSEDRSFGIDGLLLGEFWRSRIVALGRILVAGYGLYNLGSPPVRSSHHSQFLSCELLFVAARQECRGVRVKIFD